MCAGHEEQSPTSNSTIKVSTLSQSVQHPQNNKNKPPKVKNKQTNRQFTKPQTPPKTSSQTALEIVKSNSIKLANQTRYVDV